MGSWCEAWKAQTQEGAPPQPRALSKRGEAAPSLRISFRQALILWPSDTQLRASPCEHIYYPPPQGPRESPTRSTFFKHASTWGGRSTQTLEGAPHAGMASGLLIRPPLQLPTHKPPWDWAGGGSYKFREVFRGWKQQPRFP